MEKVKPSKRTSDDVLRDHLIIQGAAEDAGRASLERAKHLVARQRSMLIEQIQYLMCEWHLDSSETTVRTLLNRLSAEAE